MSGMMFTIPKKKKILEASNDLSGDDLHFIDTAPNSSNFKEVENLVFKCLAEPKLQNAMCLQNVRRIVNKKLEKRFMEYKHKIRSLGHSDLESCGFLLATSTPQDITDILRNGLAIGSSVFGELGKVEQGVYLSNHPDLVTPALFQRECPLKIILFRTLKGRQRKITVTGNKVYDASSDYNSYTSDLNPGRSTRNSRLYKYRNSEVFYYELDEKNRPVKHPSGLWPIAVFDLCLSSNFRPSPVFRHHIRNYTGCEPVSRGVWSQGIFKENFELSSIADSLYVVRPVYLGSFQVLQYCSWTNALQHPIFKLLFDKKYCGSLLLTKEIMIETNDNEKWFAAHYLFRETNDAFPKKERDMAIKRQCAVGGSDEDYMVFFFPQGEMSSLLGVPYNYYESYLNAVFLRKNVSVQGSYATSYTSFERERQLSTFEITEPYFVDGNSDEFVQACRQFYTSVRKPRSSAGSSTAATSVSRKSSAPVFQPISPVKGLKSILSKRTPDIRTSAFLNNKTKENEKRNIRWADDCGKSLSNYSSFEHDRSADHVSRFRALQRQEIANDKQALSSTNALHSNNIFQDALSSLHSKGLQDVGLAPFCLPGTNDGGASPASDPASSSVPSSVASPSPGSAPAPPTITSSAPYVAPVPYSVPAPYSTPPPPLLAPAHPSTPVPAPVPPPSLPPALPSAKPPVGAAVIPNFSPVGPSPMEDNMDIDDPQEEMNSGDKEVVQEPFVDPNDIDYDSHFKKAQALPSVEEIRQEEIREKAKENEAQPRREITLDSKQYEREKDETDRQVDELLKTILGGHRKEIEREKEKERERKAALLLDRPHKDTSTNSNKVTEENRLNESPGKRKSRFDMPAPLKEVDARAKSIEQTPDIVHVENVIRKPPIGGGAMEARQRMMSLLMNKQRNKSIEASHNSGSSMHPPAQRPPQYPAYPVHSIPQPHPPMPQLSNSISTSIPHHQQYSHPNHHPHPALYQNQHPQHAHPQAPQHLPHLQQAQHGTHPQHNQHVQHSQHSQQIQPPLPPHPQISNSHPQYRQNHHHNSHPHSSQQSHHAYPPSASALPPMSNMSASNPPTYPVSTINYGPNNKQYYPPGHYVNYQNYGYQHNQPSGYYAPGPGAPYKYPGQNQNKAFISSERPSFSKSSRPPASPDNSPDNSSVPPTLPTVANAIVPPPAASPDEQGPASPEDAPPCATIPSNHKAVKSIPLSIGTKRKYSEEEEGEIVSDGEDNVQTRPTDGQPNNAPSSTDNILSAPKNNSSSVAPKAIVPSPAVSTPAPSQTLQSKIGDHLPLKVESMNANLTYIIMPDFLSFDPHALKPCDLKDFCLKLNSMNGGREAKLMNHMHLHLHCLKQIESKKNTSVDENTKKAFEGYYEVLMEFKTNGLVRVMVEHDCDVNSFRTQKDIIRCLNLSLYDCRKNNPLAKLIYMSNQHPTSALGQSLTKMGVTVISPNLLFNGFPGTTS